LLLHNVRSTLIVTGCQISDRREQYRTESIQLAEKGEGQERENGKKESRFNG